jgi:hypothetical protein
MEDCLEILAVCIMHLFCKQKEGCGIVTRLIKLEGSFWTVKLNISQSRSVALLMEGPLDEDRVLIRDIPEPIIEFLCNIRLDNTFL